MEKIIKIEGKGSTRELICDLCNQLLKDEFYATIWVERRNIYLEKYICPSCYEEVYSNKKYIPLDKADKNIKSAIEENLQQEYYGFVTPFNTWEELQEYLENPELIRKKGKIF